MYDFSQKQELKSRAKVAHIDIYRAMLSERAHPAANWISIDQEQLAKDFLYILLDMYTIEEIEARTQPFSPALKVTLTGTAEPALTGIKKIAKNLEKVTQEVKKNSKKEKSIQKLTGTISKTLSSALQTVSSLIESLPGDVFRSWKS